MKVKKLQVDEKDIVIVDGLLGEIEAIKLGVVTSDVPIARKGVTSNFNDQTLHYVAESKLLVVQNFPFYSTMVSLIEDSFGGSPIHCERIVYREIVYGDHLVYHQDSLEEGSVTAVVYLNNVWEESFHGETLFKDADGIGVSVLPVPWRLTFFDSRLFHSSSAPSRVCYEARKILVFNFVRTKARP